MEIKLKKRPKGAKIIEGFPGFGLVGTIASEFLIDHLDTEYIGSIWLKELPPTLAIHGGKIIQPIGIHYSKAYNLIIIHGITVAKGIEWKIAEAIIKLGKDLQADEIISLEGVGSREKVKNPRSFYFTTSEKHKDKIKSSEIEHLDEGIVVGVTSAILLKSDIPVMCVFAETQSNLPDSKAAAKIVEKLDQYLNLKVDYKPLIKQAEDFENKLKNLLSKSQEMQEMQDKKKLSYVG